MDRVMHGVVCLFVTSITGSILFFLGEVPSIIAGALFALGMGIGKEMGDYLSSDNKWDWYDLLADGIGIALGIITLLQAWGD